MIVALNILLCLAPSQLTIKGCVRLCMVLAMEILPLMIGKGKQKKKKERRKYIKKDSIKIKGHASMGNMCIFGW